MNHKTPNVSVLTYHATNISGNKYHTNDHIALEQDLILLSELKVKLLSAHDLVQWLMGIRQLNPTDSYAVLTFDDGSELDYSDWQHPTCGHQIAFHSILENHKHQTNEYIHATSFVIASVQAREILQQTCLGGYQMWGDDWWQQAENKQLISIENHSWDHLHPTIDTVKQQHNLKGDFSAVNCKSDAQAQISDSSDYIESRIKNKQVTLFAYPYGDFNSFLTDKFFPNQQNKIKGAFTCEPAKVTQLTNVWKIPRYVCGMHWKNKTELKKMITD